MKEYIITKTDLEWQNWQLKTENERLKAENSRLNSENVWARKNVDVVIDVNNKLKTEIESLKKQLNGENVPLAIYPNVFTKSKAWKADTSHDDDRMTYDEAAAYLEMELDA
ncbi:hypothetical protein Hs20B_02230 [Lactococcus insecticola]|uniref:Uncharacterized protein n=2 Tax=Pseudolactococcus insecticola TaxID=2709158 RepID=A0A6A0B556_9LACT|nr:hypothetical protein Hs20B_02230 [Lactococcus insecticola]